VPSRLCLIFLWTFLETEVRHQTRRGLSPRGPETETGILVVVVIVVAAVIGNLGSRGFRNGNDRNSVKSDHPGAVSGVVRKRMKRWQQDWPTAVRRV